MKHHFRMIKTNGIQLRAVVQGKGPLIVLVHGFPESWYSWRHQMAPLADAGYTVCAIDVRGYGGSDKPHEIEAYDIKSLCADVAGVIDALSPHEPAIVVGHDWGALIAWHTAVLHPEKVRAVAGLSVPYTGQPPAPLIQLFKAMFTDQGKFFYQVYFQDEGVAEAEFEADVRGCLRKLYFAGSGGFNGDWMASKKKHGEPFLNDATDPSPFPAWLTPADIDYFVSEFEQSGFRGPLNRYRNSERDWDIMNGVTDRKVHQPSLFIAGEKDAVVALVGGPAGAEAAMRANTTDFRGMYLLPKIGHWTAEEAPHETNSALLAWLKTL